MRTLILLALALSLGACTIAVPEHCYIDRYGQRVCDRL